MRISDWSSDVCSSDLLAAAVAETVAERLTEDEAGNVAVIRGAMLDNLAAQQPGSELHSLRLALASLAADADVVLDLPCDDQALMHLFLIPAPWPPAAEDRKSAVEGKGGERR